MTDHERLLLQALQALRGVDPMPQDYHYRSAVDFVLRHGRFYQPCQLPRGVKAGPPNECFRTSYLVAARFGWRYVEGYVLEERLPFSGQVLLVGRRPRMVESPLTATVVHHAWVEGEDGMAVDNAPGVPDLAYFGVSFSVARADDSLWRGNAPVLDDHRRGWPVFRAPWDPAERPPPASGWAAERLRLLRDGRHVEATRYMGWCRPRREKEGR